MTENEILSAELRARLQHFVIILSLFETHSTVVATVLRTNIRKHKHNSLFHWVKNVTQQLLSFEAICIFN